MPDEPTPNHPRSAAIQALQDRIIRVFISSTFRDMMRERDLLVKEVFPELRRTCAKRFVTFTEVDLRWGITEDQANEGQVLPLCLAEIERSRPYFIGLLGERYGWIPDTIRPEVIKREPWLQEHVQGRTSVTELEILHGVLNNPLMQSHAFFYFRDPAYVHNLALTDEERPDMAERDIQADIQKYGAAEATRRTEERKAKLAALKQRIRDSKLPLVEPYANPKAVAEIIRQQFDELIDQLYPEDQTPDPLAQERMAHEAHAKNKLFACIDRPEHLKAVNAFAEPAEHDGKGLVVTGESGGGKTALLAAWARDWAKSHPEDFLFQHYFGATPDSASPDGFLRRLLGELKSRFSITDDIPSDSDKLREALPMWLAQTSGKGRIVLVLDGLNHVQGSEPDLHLLFLPRLYPPHVTALASALPGPALDALRERGWAEHELPLAGESEVDSMVGEYFRIHGRHVDAEGRPLQTELRRQLVAAPGAKCPLFLRTVLDELRQFGTFEKLPERVHHYLEVDNPKDLFLRVVKRWQEDFDGKDPKNDRQKLDLVRRALTHLWAARQGLSETEWLDLLGDGLQPLPRALWTPLFLALEAHLSQRAGLLAFGHGFLRQAVEQMWLSSPDDQRAVHSALADYFESHPSQADMTERKAAEWPFQLQAAQSWARLESCLTDMPLFFALYNDNTKWELTRYWIPLRENGRDFARAYKDAYSRLVEAGSRLASADQAEVMRHNLAHMLGSLFLENGCYPAAEEMLQLAYAARKRLLGDQNANTLSTAHNLAMAIGRLGRSDEAEALFRQTLEVWDRLGISNKNVMATVSALAVLLHQRGACAEAEPLHRRAIDISQSLFGREHPVTFVALDNYGNCLVRMGRLSAAESCYSRAYEGLDRLLGSAHPDTLTALHNLVSMRIKTDQTEGMSALIDTLIRSTESALGSQHPDTIISLDNAATWLSRNGDLTRAERLRRQALAAAERVLGEEHKETLAIRMNLATLFSRQGRRDQSVGLMRRELRRIERVFGPNDPYTINCIEDLAMGVEECGHWGEACQLYRDALARSSKARSRENPDHQNLIENYSDLLQKLGFDEAEILREVASASAQ